MNGDNSVLPAGTPATPADTTPATPSTPQTPPAGTQAGNEPDTTPSTPPAGEDENEQITLENARKLRRENQTLRERAKAGEAALAKLAEIERAQMSELERARADAQQAAQQVEQMRAALGVSALEAAARKLGFTDPSDAHQMAAKLEYDAEGRPGNAETLVRALLASKPHYAQASNIGGSPTNPARNNATGGAGAFTTSQLADFGFWEKNRPAIEQAMREGRIIKDN